MKSPDEIKKGMEWDEVNEALRKISLDDAGESDMRKPKTSADIKKGLQCCLGDTHAYHCDECPYSDDESDVDDGCGDNGIQLLEDALELIQQLEAENNSLKFTKATDADVHRYQKAEMRTIIQQLQAENAEQADRIRQLEAENDDMLETIKRMVICGADCGGCMHFVEEPDKNCVELDFECEKCQDKCACYSCKDGSNYEWKGLAKKK